MKLKVGDKAIVIAGSNKGKIGKIIKVFSKESKVIVEGVNVVKRHKKADAQNQTGGIIEFEAPIHSSNVMLIDPKTGKGTRKKVSNKEVTKKEIKVKKEEPKVTDKKVTTGKKTKIKKETVSKKTNKKEDK